MRYVDSLNEGSEEPFSYFPEEHVKLMIGHCLQEILDFHSTKARVLFVRLLGALVATREYQGLKKNDTEQDEGNDAGVIKELLEEIV